jgi:hypothetical protein
LSRKLKTKPCDQAVARRRLAAANSFLQTAETAIALTDSDDAYRWSSATTNFVHAGIASADAICCAVLGEHSQGDDHRQAVELLSRVVDGGREFAKDLGLLLSLKTTAGYGAAPMSEHEAKRARRAAERLVGAARDRVT